SNRLRTRRCSSTKFGHRAFAPCSSTVSGECTSAAHQARAPWLQVVRGLHGSDLRAGRYRDRRAERLRQVECLRRCTLGPRGTASTAAARLENGGSDLPGLVGPPTCEPRRSLPTF